MLVCVCVCMCVYICVCVCVFAYVWCYVPYLESTGYVGTGFINSKNKQSLPTNTPHASTTDNYGNDGHACTQRSIPDFQTFPLLPVQLTAARKEGRKEGRKERKRERERKKERERDKERERENEKKERKKERKRKEGKRK